MIPTSYLSLDSKLSSILCVMKIENDLCFMLITYVMSYIVTAFDCVVNSRDSKTPAKSILNIAQSGHRLCQRIRGFGEMHTSSQL